MTAERRRRIQCPTCNASIGLPPSAKAGLTIRCPKCGQRSQLESVPAEPAPVRQAADRPVPVVQRETEPPPRRSGIKAIIAGAVALGILIVSGAAAYKILGGNLNLSFAGIGGLAPAEESEDGKPPDDGGGGPDNPPSELAVRVHDILKANCHRCHGEGGTAEGGFNFVLRRDKLVEAGGYVVPGNLNESRLLERIVDGQMPPDAAKLADADIDSIKQWISAGAPEFLPAVKREFITNERMFEYIKTDLTAATPERDRRFVRYFTLTHLYNAGLSDDEMETYRLALNKLLNSLSWSRQIVKPRALDPEKTVMRLDLRDLAWTDEIWRKIISADPYAIVHNLPSARICQGETDCQVPSVRGDWFVQAASQPPLYYDVIQIPKDKPMDEVQRMLRVDINLNLERHKAARAGFNASGVSQNNRLIERHDSSFGALWVSYDFAGNTGRKNLFDHPLGPGNEDRHFEHDGGEIIFNLPNGLQGYLLVDAKNNLLDKGPTSIVSDEGRPDRAVVNGLSCIACHYAGIIQKNDAVRANVLANKASYPESEDILLLYPEKTEMTRLQEEDAKRFQDACKQLGIEQFTKTGEPVVNMAKRFESDLDRALASAELGLTPEKFATQISKSPELGRVLGVLNVEGGTLKREVFVKHFGDAAKKFGLGTIFNENAGKKTEPKTPGEKPAKDDSPQIVKGGDSRNGPASVGNNTNANPPKDTPATDKPPVDLPPGEPNIEAPVASKDNFTKPEKLTYTSGPKSIRPGLVRNWVDRRGRFVVHGELVAFDEGKTVQVRRENGGISEVEIDILSDADQRIVFDHVSSEPPADLPGTEESGGIAAGRPGLVARKIIEFRTWTPVTDDREPFEAMYVGVVGPNVVLKKRDGEVVRGPLAGLCDEDQAYVSEMRVGRGRRPISGGPGGQPPPLDGENPEQGPPRPGRPRTPPQNAPGGNLPPNGQLEGNGGDFPAGNSPPRGTPPGAPGRPPAGRTPPRPPADFPPVAPPR